jgi:hypothetical protein
MFLTMLSTAITDTEDYVQRLSFLGTYHFRGVGADRQGSIPSTENFSQDRLGYGFEFPEGMVTGVYVDHSPPSSAKVHNGETIPPLPPFPLPHQHIFMAKGLIDYAQGHILQFQKMNLFPPSEGL